MVSTLFTADSRCPVDSTWLLSGYGRTIGASSTLDYGARRRPFTGGRSLLSTLKIGRGRRMIRWHQPSPYGIGRRTTRNEASICLTPGRSRRVSFERGYRLKKKLVSSWEELSEKHRRALIKDLIEDWPTRSQEDKEFVMLHDPDRVKAAGLWPDQGAEEPKK
jgi:hypothetical protein